MRPSRTRSYALLAAALTTPVLAAGCSDDGSSSSEHREALDYLPASATALELRDVDAAEKRLEISDVDDEEEYVSGIQDSDWSGISALAQYLQVIDNPPWTAMDVQWEAMATLDDGKQLWVRKLDDDLDMESAIDGFETAGYTVDEQDDGTYLSADPDDFSGPDMGYWAGIGFDVLVLPDENVAISGEDAENAYDDDSETLADAGTFDDLLDVEPIEAEYTYGYADPHHCDPANAFGGDGRALSPEQSEAAFSQYADLGIPEAAAFTLGSADDEPAAVTLLRFEDDDAARADLDARTELIEDGSSIASTKPYSDYLTIEDSSVDGDTEEVELSPADEPSVLTQMVAQRDAPFLACAPSS